MELLGVLCALVFGVPLAVFIGITSDPLLVIAVIALMFSAYCGLRIRRRKKRDKVAQFFPGGDIRY